MAKVELTTGTQCVVCLEDMVLERKPRALACLHTLCHDCIVKMLQPRQRDIPQANNLFGVRPVQKHHGGGLFGPVPCVQQTLRCPVCQRVTNLPPSGVEGLPINTMLCQIKEVESLLRRSDLCQNCKVSNAMKFCETCSKRLCSDCQRRHDNIPAFQSHFVRQVGTKIKLCKEHANEAEYICSVCAVQVCMVCVLSGPHQEHTDKIEKYAKWMSVQREKIKKWKEEMNLKWLNVQKYIKQYTDYDENICKTMSQIKETTEKLKDMIQNECDDMIATLSEKHIAAAGALRQLRQLNNEAETFLQSCDQVVDTEAPDVRKVLVLTDTARSFGQGLEQVQKLNTKPVSFVPNELDGIGILTIKSEEV